MAKAHSSRKRPAGRACADSTDPQTLPPAGASIAKPPDFAEFLDRFSDGLAVVETAYRALENSMEDETPFSPGVLTLQRGIEELLNVYNDFDLAISAMR